MTEIKTEVHLDGEKIAQAVSDQQNQRSLAVRRFDVQIEAGTGRTVELLIAPFGEIATCADGLGGLPKGIPYQEELMPGLYDKQLRAANRVFLNFEHQQGMSGLIGHGLSLRRGSEGYYGDFRVQETPDGDKALDFVRNNVLRGASVESYWLKSVRAANGVVQRVKAHLEAVALCREGAYPSAVVTGLRAEDSEPQSIILDESLLPIEPDPELLERCRSLGVRLPQRYEAHPADNGHPGETGTPEDGTRQSDNPPTSEET